MSRSKRKTPICSILVLGTSEKADKKRWHRRLRSREKTRLADFVRDQSWEAVQERFFGFLPAHKREIVNTIYMRKEWRVYWKRSTSTDAKVYRQWMAK